MTAPIIPDEREFEAWKARKRQAPSLAPVEDEQDFEAWKTAHADAVSTAAPRAPLTPRDYLTAGKNLAIGVGQAALTNLAGAGRLAKFTPLGLGRAEQIEEGAAALDRFSRRLGATGGARPQDVGARAIGNVGGNVAAFMVPGAAAAKATQGARALTRLGAQVGMAAPLTAAQAMTREGSTTGALASLFPENDLLEKAASSVPGRVVGDLVTDAALVGAGEAVSAGLRHAKPAAIRRTLAGKIDPSMADELRGAQRAAEVDPLTGLANRRALDRALPAAEADAATRVVRFDANNFGAVNKAVGEREGDKALKEIADAIKQAADEHGVGQRAFRRGGDEFTVLAPEDVAEGVKARAEELYGARKYGDTEVSLTGYVSKTYDEADQALQAAKAARKAGAQASTEAPAPTRPLETPAPPARTRAPRQPKMYPAARDARGALRDVPRVETDGLVRELNAIEHRHMATNEELGQTTQQWVRQTDVGSVVSGGAGAAGMKRARLNADERVMARIRAELGKRGVGPDEIEERMVAALEREGMATDEPLAATIQGFGTPFGGASPAVVASLGSSALGAAGGGAAGARVGGTPEERKRNAIIGAVGGAAVGAGLGYLGTRMAQSASNRPVQAYMADPDVAGVHRMISYDANPGQTRNARQFVRDLYTRVVDELYPLRRFGKEIGQSNALSAEATRASGWKGAAYQRIRDEFKPVLDVARGHEEGVNALVAAERALELARHGLDQKGIDLAQAQAAVNTLGAVPEVRRAADALRAYYRSLLDAKLANGVIDQAQYQAIIAKGDLYVPFVRDFAPPPSAGGGKLVNRGTGVRKMDEGKASSKIVDPFRQAIADTYEAERTIAKQRVTNIVAEIVQRDPQAASPFIRQIPQGATAKTGNVVQANVGGHRQSFEVVDGDLYQAWGAFDPVSQNVAVKILAPFKRALQFGVTVLPDFAAANAMRDGVMTSIQYRFPAREAVGGAAIGAAAGASLDPENRVRGAAQGAGLGLGVGAMTPHIARTLSAMRDIAGLGGRTGVYEQFLRDGGTGFGFFPRDGASQNRLLAELRRTPGFHPEDIISPRRWVDVLQKIGETVETAPRLARYKEALAGGATSGEAVAQARDISLDFGKIGRDMKSIAASKAFFNAKVQGWDKLVRMLKSPKTWAVGATTITAPTIALWSVNKDNPEYWDRPQWERNTFWLLPKPDGGFFRVYKPFEVGFIFASIPERILDWTYQRDPETLEFAIKDMAKTTFGDLLPIPTAVQPALEAKTNYSLFRNRPIVPQNLERLEPAYQFDDRTSNVARVAGKAFGASPMQIDNTIRGLTGGVGQLASEGIDRVARSTGADARPAPLTPSKTLRSRFVTRPDVLSDQAIAIRRRYEAAEMVRATAEAIAKQGNEAEYERYVESHERELAEYGLLKAANDELKNIADARRKIAGARNLTDEERRQTTMELIALENQIARTLAAANREARSAVGQR